MKEVIERCNWLINNCNDRWFTPDVKDDITYLLEEIERLNNIINELEKYIHNELILDFYDEDMPCELIINKMENMINELKGDSSNG